MTIGKKLHEMAVFVEFLVGSGLAIFFHTVLKFEQGAYTIFGVGALLSLVTYLIREEILRTKSALVEEYRLSHEIPGAMAAITDAECKIQAQEIISSTMKALTLLQQGYIQLDEMNFYLEGAKLADRAVRQIRCVDVLPSGWLTRATLVNYYQSNVRALERGVSVTRVFVTTRDEINDAEVLKVIAAQHRDGIDVRVAFREDLPNSVEVSGREIASSFDFAIYDQNVATDAFVHPGRYYGRKTCERAEVAKYQHLYDLIEHSAHMVTEEGDRLILSSVAVELPKPVGGGDADPFAAASIAPS
ncbi:hypothetical protein LPW11_18970 [Geomonas sp. RF6]|uniref:hypothetical protein n=1 Tax=Geomonas sp. RF6 TaxID=2897342 RepID=UPI001E4A90EF|nr:hypothetical protein [Geomonas sp. RF6]UFS69953.1 hypothetical protein LPW11_18970 [Geomonas sp. RF6]